MAKSIVEMLAQMEKIISRQKSDALKFDNGVNAPGVRVRKGMQRVRRLAKSIRIEIQNVKTQRKANSKDHVE